MEISGPGLEREFLSKLLILQSAFGHKLDLQPLEGNLVQVLFVSWELAGLVNVGLQCTDVVLLVLCKKVIKLIFRRIYFGNGETGSMYLQS